ncbi:hypothetical protein RN001_006478 [Aquatica leii]|uniref:Serpin domain-containing protein n=1 Tax=Aquatica leii TaxID=1421715 RepID=A0AAN7Q1S6_9COLE|nr:hypothetical protein RN001_006478 [Aquatica leii]
MKIIGLIFLVVYLARGEKLKEYHDSNLQFASNIYTEFASKNNGNFLLCPLSAQTILSLAAVGAKETTAEQLSAALNLPADTSKIENMFQQISPYLDINTNYQLLSANKIYTKMGISLKDDFKTLAENTFKADIQNINFDNKEAATKEINEWVETKTHNKIKDLLSDDSIKPNTAAILVNAIYFKADWLSKFGKAFQLPFHITKTKQVETDMMVQRNDFNYYYNKDLHAEFLEMPFIGNDVVLTIALPKEIDGLSDLEKSMSRVLAMQPYQELDTIVTIPKFTMETKIDFKSILQSLGATLPFSNNANFKGMSDIPLKIDEVVQKTFIEVTETGATAAAATHFSVMMVSMPRADFTADRPFIYYLRHKEFASKNNGNFLLCPLSAQTILSLAAVGAKETTAQQLSAALNLPADSSKIQNMFQQISPYLDINTNYQLLSANKIYTKMGISLKDDYKTLAENTFNAEIQNINFDNNEAATKEINDWVETKTHNKIKDLLSKDTIKPDTAAVLVNAIYFKADWLNKFGKAFQMPFHITKTKTVETNMMLQRNDFNYYYNKDIHAEFLEMPFIGNDVVLTIALPKEIDGLSDLEKSISRVLAIQPYEELDAIVTIPKFTMETKIDFKSILESLGATLPFSNNANFKGMSDIPLKIDEVAQKTFIEVTETGATAVAATDIWFILLLACAVRGEKLKEYHESNLQFASNIYTKFASKHDGNFLFCPLSAQTILALAAVGAKETTAQQLSSVLNLPSEPSKIEHMFQQISLHLDINKTYQLVSANKIYTKTGIPLKNDFKTLAQNTFKADIQNINFNNKEAATKEINDWVETKTHNKIKHLLSEDSIKSNTAAVLVNTVYFQGEWVQKFGIGYEMPFHVTKTKTVDTYMMMERNKYNYYYNENLNAEFVEMPFIGDDVVMTIVLPKEIDGLSNLEKSMSRLLALQPYEQYDAVVIIPKFTMETKIDFKPILQSLGATLPFSNSANFNGISDVPLKIDEVAQKAFIEITENGATASAATYFSIMVLSGPSVEFTANHPFIYYLRHKAATIDLENVVVSATAAQTVLVLLKLGTSGIPWEELSNLTRLPENDDLIKPLFKNLVSHYFEYDDQWLQVWNAFFYNYTLTIKDSYQNSVINDFKSSVEFFNFEEKKMLIRLINEGFRDALNPHLSNTVDSDIVQPDTKVIISNAVSVAAKWRKPFLRSSKPFYVTFHVNNSYSVDVEYMRQIGYYNLNKNEQLNVVSLDIPFQAGNLVFTIYLAQNTTSTKVIEDNLQTLIATKNSTLVDVFVSIPKFVLDSTVFLKSIAHHLGYEDIFANREYTNMIDEPLLIRDITHRNFLNVTEAGINVKEEHAASYITSRRSRRPTEIFSATHPFIFTVTDRNTGIIYIGKSATRVQTWFVNYTMSNILFASDVYQQLASRDEDFIISPTILQSSLALLTTGAKDQTFVELCRTLYLPKSVSKIEAIFGDITHQFPVNNPVVINIPRKIYFNNKYRVSDNFRSTAVNAFKASIENVNFRDTTEAVAKINEWISIQTERPVNVVDNKTVTASTKLVVINSLFIRGRWLSPFDETIPLSVKFNVNDTYSEVVGMHTIVDDFSYYKDDILRVEYLDIPLQDRNTYLTIILPREDNSLLQVEQNMYSVLNTNTRINITLLVTIPNIYLESHIDLVDTLKSLGLITPFNEDANFQNIVDGSEFHLENIIENIQFQTNRDGINAENVELLRDKNATPTQTFTANRPFIYTVSNSHGGILLLGRYSRPPNYLNDKNV